MAASGHDSDEPIAAINITPFVDIILVVLIIFMLATPVIMNPGINVNLPQAASGDATTPSQFTVTLTNKGEIFLNGKAASADEVQAEAAKFAKSNPAAQAIIAADKEVPHGQVIAVIDQVKAAGIHKFAISTQKK